MAGRDMLCPVCHAPVRVPAAGPREGELEPAADAGAETSPADGATTAETDSIWVSDAAPPPAAVPPPLPRSEGSQSTGSTIVPDRGERPPWGLAAGLLAATAYSAAPALAHLADDPIAGWTRLVLGVAALQTVFVLWMLTVRHWAAIWSVAVVFAAASAAYGAITAFAFAAGAGPAPALGHGADPPPGGRLVGNRAGRLPAGNLRLREHCRAAASRGGRGMECVNEGLRHGQPPE